MPVECEELTGSIIGAAIAVHRELGPGFIESVYGNALDVEMRHRQIPFVRQLGVPVLYRGVEVGMHRLDLFVQGEIVVELKAVKELRRSLRRRPLLPTCDAQQAWAHPQLRQVHAGGEARCRTTRPLA